MTGYLRCQLNSSDWSINIYWNPCSLQPIYHSSLMICLKIAQRYPSHKDSSGYVMPCRPLTIHSPDSKLHWEHHILAKANELFMTHFTSRITAFEILCQTGSCGRVFWVHCEDEWCIVLFSNSFINANPKSDIFPASQLESLNRLLLSEVKSNTVNWKHFWLPLTLRRTNDKCAPAVGGTDHSTFFSFTFWNAFCLFSCISSAEKSEPYFDL